MGRPLHPGLGIPIQGLGLSFHLKDRLLHLVTADSQHLLQRFRLGIEIRGQVRAMGGE